MTLPAQSSFPDFHDALVEGIKLNFDKKEAALFLEVFIDETDTYEQVTLSFFGVAYIEVPSLKFAVVDAEIFDITITWENDSFSVSIVMVFERGPSWELRLTCQKYGITSG